MASRDSVERRKAGAALAEKIYTRKEREKTTQKIKDQRKGKGKNVFIDAQLKALQKPGTTAVMNNGIVTGVRDAQGRLTGYDVAQIRQRMLDKMSRGKLSPNQRRLLALEQRQAAATSAPATVAPTIVKRTELAEEIEAERARRRRLQLTPLGNRSLLSNTSTLGAS
jgi:hypothetical protein